ncbi:MAG: hypothetical protein ACK2TV_15120 [Anaerolineales bacterium]
MEKITYGGWDNCFRVANEHVELVVTGDVGPRIIRFGFLGGRNMFKEYPDQMGVTQGEEWLIIGGHRLWHAPEGIPRSYYPDLEPVLIQETPDGMVLTQKPEPTTGLQKQIEIKLDPEEPEVILKHTLINHNLWTIETAPWALSVMAPGGVAVLCFPQRGPHPDYILPTSSLTIWPYTDLSDPRWVWGQRYFLLKQVSQNSNPQKIGIFAPDGWAAYINENMLFIKQVAIQFEGIYPDMGANFEVFTNDTMLELESLGPMENIPPKGQISHQEHWTLVNDVPIPQSEEDVIEHILPHLESTH